MPVQSKPLRQSRQIVQYDLLIFFFNVTVVYGGLICECKDDIKMAEPKLTAQHLCPQ